MTHPRGHEKGRGFRILISLCSICLNALSLPRTYYMTLMFPEVMTSFCLQSVPKTPTPTSRNPTPQLHTTDFKDGYRCLQYRRTEHQADLSACREHYINTVIIIAVCCHNNNMLSAFLSIDSHHLLSGRLTHSQDWDSALGYHFFCCPVFPFGTRVSQMYHSIHNHLATETIS